MRRRSASRIRVPTTEITIEVRQPARFEKKTNTSEAPGLWRGRSARLAALDEPDDQRRAQDGEDDAARAPEQHAADDPAHDRAPDTHEDRHRDAHGVRPRDHESAQGTDHEPGDDDPDDEQNHDFSLVFGNEAYPSAPLIMQASSRRGRARSGRRARTRGRDRRTTARPLSNG